MSLDTRTRHPDTAIYAPPKTPLGPVGLRPNLGERIVAAIAVTIAVLIVAGIAVLMGIA